MVVEYRCTLHNLLAGRKDIAERERYKVMQMVEFWRGNGKTWQDLSGSDTIFRLLIPTNGNDSFVKAK